MAKVQQLRLAQTRVLAPDNGIISARSATVGAVLQWLIQLPALAKDTDAPSSPP